MMITAVSQLIEHSDKRNYKGIYTNQSYYLEVANLLMAFEELNKYFKEY